jgi:hypothetical protein
MTRAANSNRGKFRLFSHQGINHADQFWVDSGNRLSPSTI